MTDRTTELTALGINAPVLLAPMAGITDLPFRSLVRSFGAGLVVSEMVACREMLTGRPGVLERAALGLGPGADATAVQIAGCEAAPMAETARRLEAGGARILDINMGCPAKKVTAGLSGSALMRDPDHALRLVEAVVGAVRVPVTLKMRLGWDADSICAPAIARRAAQAGVRMVTVHGRTRCQFYRGAADWSAVRQVVRAVDVPVVVNGDIRDAASARRALGLSGAAAVMVGRGVQGRPWALAEIIADLTGGAAPVIPRGGAFAEMVARHVEASCAFYGRDLGTRVVRKHLGWYLEGADPALRRSCLTAEGPEDVRRRLADHPVEVAA